MLTDKQVRGKLVNQGVRSLSDAELLSILLQKGEAGGSALEWPNDYWKPTITI